MFGCKLTPTADSEFRFAILIDRFDDISLRVVGDFSDCRAGYTHSACEVALARALIEDYGGGLVVVVRGQIPPWSHIEAVGRATVSLALFTTRGDPLGDIVAFDLAVATIVGKRNDAIDLDEGVWSRGLTPISERGIFGD